MSEPVSLPAWAEELKRRYVRGEVSQFLLHGNVHDLVLHGGRTLSLADFLCEVLLGASKDTIALYDASTGVSFAKRRDRLPGVDELLLQRSRERVLPALERLLVTEDRFALILPYAEALAPAGDLALSGEADRAALVTLHRWAGLPALERSDNVILLVTENLSELHPRLVNSARVAAVRIPLPGLEERLALVRLVAPGFAGPAAERLAEITAGLKLVQIRAMLRPADAEPDLAARESFLRELLGAEATAERVEGLARLTKGMGPEEIRRLVAPQAELQAAELPDELAAEVSRRKRELIERECAGLLEFVAPRHGFDAVGGMEEVKRELRRVAANVREGRTEHVPMGFLFVGPMGTGKTFVAEAFAREAGLAAVRFGSFRSKWVGATEANLERILDVLAGLGQVIVFLDEAERALAGGDSDGGTESRVIARLKEFMSDTSNRGRVLFVLMTNRPDRLDTDLKRTGRLDRKIPFFFAQSPEEVEPVVAALVKRHGLAAAFELAAERDAVGSRLVGYSNADLEGVVLLAASHAETAGRPGRLEIGDMTRAVEDYLPSRDAAMLELMELLAVFEASNRSMLPPKYRTLAPEDLSERLAAARLRVGNRR